MMSSGKVRLVADVGLVLDVLSTTNNRAPRSRSTPLSLIPLPQARADGGKAEVHTRLFSGSYACTLWPDPWQNVASAVVAPFSTSQFFFFNNVVTQRASLL
ncbi:hypothetical protein D1007_44673 [Hordeum vulgare]|nr:hypothetical protein D1007_44673 [Hordeum vulgare]